MLPDYEIPQATRAALLNYTQGFMRERVAAAQALREAHKAADERTASFALDLLGVLDSLESQLAFLAAQPREAPWPRLEKNLGVTRNKLLACLAEREVVPLAVAIGEPPDYAKCVAVERREVAGVVGEQVVEVLRMGYSLGELVLRTAEVAVAIGSSGKSHGDS
jgi:molecular chaperone GrpE (heat shock protein)